MLYKYSLFNNFSKFLTKNNIIMAIKQNKGYHNTANKNIINDGINKKGKQRNISTSKVNNGNRMNMILYKKHGQHLLKNPGILDKIIMAAKIKSSDIVLEIGCGTGNLTIKLLPLAKKVITIDIDARMINEVKKRCLYEGYNNLEVYEGDAIKTIFPKFDVCTANIPYKISSPLIFKLIAHRPLFKCAVLMFQKEFAERMLANVGDSNYSRLTVNVKLFCRVIKVCNVDRSSFNPPPKVDSIVLKLIPKENNSMINFDEWDNLLRICFSRKRKTLHAIFKRNAVLNMLEHNYKNYCTFNKIVPVNYSFKTFCLDTLKDLEMEEQRSINLDENDFIKLLLEFNKKGIRFFNIANTKGVDSANVFLDDEDDEEGKQDNHLNGQKKKRKKNKNKKINENENESENESENENSSDDEESDSSAN